MVKENINREQSEFNEAISFLSRLNNWFYISSMATLEMDSQTWFSALIILFKELSQDMTPDEIEEKNKEIFEINNLLETNKKNNNQSGRKEITGELYKRLHDFELFLRKIYRDAGYQTRIADDATQALK